MLHKLTALILTCLMLVVSITAQVGLNYCLCEKTVFIGGCPCELPVAKNDSAAAQSSCCDCCASEEVVVIVDASTTDDVFPCEDCVISLDLGVDQCVFQAGLDFKVNAIESTSDLSMAARAGECSFSVVLLKEIEIRGSPPSQVVPSELIYLTFERFLI